MRTRTILVVAALLAGGHVVGACSSDSNPSATTGEGSARIGPEGGVVRFQGVTLEVPPGALTTPTTLSITAGGTPPASFVALSPLYAFAPDGTVFQRPVSVTFPVDGAAKSPAVYWSGAGSGFASLGGVRDGAQITAQVTHFSEGFVAEASSSSIADASADASDGGPDGAAEDAGADGGTTADAGDADAASDGGDGDAGGDAGEAGADAAAPSVVTVNVRDAAGSPANMTWAAWQDDAGAWTQLAPNPTGVYEFTPQSARYGVALVCANGAGSSDGQIFYRTTETTQLDITAGALCAPAAGIVNYTLAGTMTNLPGNAAYVVYGYENRYGASSLSVNGGSAPFTLYGLTAGTHDYGIGLSPAITGVPGASILKMLLIRGQAVADNVPRDIDWNAEGFAPGTNYTATVTNAVNQSARVDVLYVTEAGAMYGMPLMSGALASANDTLTQAYSSVPANEQMANDQYVAYAYDGANSVRRTFHDPGDVTLALPSAPAATFAVAATAPYVRPRYSFSAIAAATGYTPYWGHYGAKQEGRTFTVNVAPAWLDGAGPYVYDFPDLSGAQGWDSSWAPPANPASGAISTSLTVTTQIAVGAGTEVTVSRASGALP